MNFESNMDMSLNTVELHLEESKVDSEVKIISSRTGYLYELSINYPFTLDTGAQKVQVNLFHDHYVSMIRYAKDEGFGFMSASGEPYSMPILTLPCIVFGEKIKIRNLKVGI